MRWDAIPGELKMLDQWVCAKTGSKVPMQADKPAPASSTDPLTWASFRTASLAVTEKRYDYLGFVFNDNGIAGIDIDDGYTDGSALSPVAGDIIARCGSYTERSRSGRGFHVFVKGRLPFKGRSNLQGVEMYQAARYFIMTGDAYRPCPVLRENQEAIDYLVETYFSETAREGASGRGSRVYRPVWEMPGDGSISLKPVYPPIPQGSRNICLTSLAGHMHSIGYDRDRLYGELMHANRAACVPPLPASEVDTIVKSVTRYGR